MDSFSVLEVYHLNNGYHTNWPFLKSSHMESSFHKLPGREEILYKAKAVVGLHIAVNYYFKPLHLSCKSCHNATVQPQKPWNQSLTLLPQRACAEINRVVTREANKKKAIFVYR